MAREIPAHWKEIMDRRGISSVRHLAQRAGLTHPPVLGVVMGDAKRPKTDTLVKIATALDIPLRDVYWLIGQENPTAEKWDPPAEASLMSSEQRDAVERIIHLFTRPAEAQDRVERGATPGNVRQLRPGLDVHPEAPGMNFAADKSHGPAEGQLFQDWVREVDEGPED